MSDRCCIFRAIWYCRPFWTYSWSCPCPSGTCKIFSEFWLRIPIAQSTFFARFSRIALEAVHERTALTLSEHRCSVRVSYTCWRWVEVSQNRRFRRYVAYKERLCLGEFECLGVALKLIDSFQNELTVVYGFFIVSYMVINIARVMYIVKIMVFSDNLTSPQLKSVSLVVRTALFLQIFVECEYSTYCVNTAILRLSSAVDGLYVGEVEKLQLSTPKTFRTDKETSPLKFELDWVKSRDAQPMWSFHVLCPYVTWPSRKIYRDHMWPWPTHH